MHKQPALDVSSTFLAAAAARAPRANGLLVLTEGKCDAQHTETILGLLLSLGLLESILELLAALNKSRP